MTAATRLAPVPAFAPILGRIARGLAGCRRLGAVAERALLALGLLVLLGGLTGCGGKLSDNADLESLGLSSGTLTPAFAPGTFVYNASVPNSVSSISVTPRSADAGAKVTVRGGRVERGAPSPALPLNVGVNSINIVVTSEDDSVVRTYVIQVVRRTADASSDASLTGLLVSAGTLDPAFSANVTAYAVSVANAVSSITVTPFSGQSPSSLTVNGAAVGDGLTSAPQALVVGANPIAVVVVSQNGSTQRTYTLTVTRAAP